MNEFWESAFSDKQEMWGMKPAKSAILALELFKEAQIKDILIPGIGYGRNAGIFVDNKISVTGIEISSTAIQLARKHFGNNIQIFHGSVTDMPFDNHFYDGIFCYGLIYLLDAKEREKLINDCYAQLSENGMIIFTAITKDAKIFEQGIEIAEDRFEMFGGVKIFFYDKKAIEEEFGNVGINKVRVVEENYPFYFIVCRKSKNLD